MENKSKRIQDLFNTGEIYEGIKLAKRHIKEYGEKDCQLEIFLLAKGLFAVGMYYEAWFWINRTNADPINRIPMAERIERKCGNGTVFVKGGI